MNNATPDFIVIDDDKLNNKICSISIEKTYRDAVIKTFLDPREGFEYLETEYRKNDRDAMLFLDINMPSMSAWEFLEQFDKLDSSIKNRIYIYILSSSVDKRDMDRAEKNPNVVYYLIKPLTKESIKLITNIKKKIAS